MRRGRLITLLAGIAALRALLPRSALRRPWRAARAARVSASVGVAGMPSRLVLAITRNGRVVYSGPVSAAGCRGHCMDVAVPPGKSPLHVLDLDGSGEPEVVLGLFTGGANCCFIDQVFSFDPGTHTYVRSQHNFLNAGAAVVAARRPLGRASPGTRGSPRPASPTPRTPARRSRSGALPHRPFTDVTRQLPRAHPRRCREVDAPVQPPPLKRGGADRRLGCRRGPAGPVGDGRHHSAAGWRRRTSSVRRWGCRTTPRRCS